MSGTAGEWEEGDVFRRVARFEDIAHAAARLAQADLDMQAAVGPEVLAQRLVAIGKAARTGGRRLATKLREGLAEARECLTERDGRPALSDPAWYAREVADARWHKAQADRKAKRANAQEANAKRARARVWGSSQRIAFLPAVLATAARGDPGAAALIGTACRRRQPRTF